MCLIDMFSDTLKIPASKSGAPPIRFNPDSYVISYRYIDDSNDISRLLSGETIK